MITESLVDSSAKFKSIINEVNDEKIKNEIDKEINKAKTLTPKL
jgi:hypothetical protein